METEETITVPSTWMVREKMFQEDQMYDRMSRFAKEKELTEFSRALPYARAMHASQKRKQNKFWPDSRVPYIIHPLMMACHACSLGIEDDQVLATVMLHDVCEDCGVQPGRLPFSTAVIHSVSLLTKQQNHDRMDNKAYYEHIMEDPCASIVKALDRCNNVSTMALSFSKAKMIEYIDETETYVYPLLDHIQHNYPQYEKPLFAIKYQLLSLTETIKAMLLETG